MLASEGTHWETMKERMGYVCQNAQGRARKKQKMWKEKHVD